MPLLSGASHLIRRNLNELRRGNRVKLVTIAVLTDVQLHAINAARDCASHPPIVAEVVFLGRHVYESRVVRDGYSLDDVLDQIEAAMHSASLVLKVPRMTVMENTSPRTDRYGNCVRDRAVFECMARHPRPELFSVIPKGDRIKPKGPPTNERPFL